MTRELLQQLTAPAWWEKTEGHPGSPWNQRMTTPLPADAESMLVEIINAAIDDDEPNAAPKLYCSIARARKLLGLSTAPVSSKDLDADCEARFYERLDQGEE